jgi:hypothetical protein
MMDGDKEKGREEKKKKENGRIFFLILRVA